MRAHAEREGFQADDREGMDSGLLSAMGLEFNELAELGRFGSQLCHVDEMELPGAVRTLGIVARRCRTQARRDGAAGLDAMVDSIETFRAALFDRLVELANRPGRRLRVAHFKEVVSELGVVLSGAYGASQAFEMGCLLSMRLTLALAVYCPGVSEADALEAMEWMAIVCRGLLDQSSASPGALNPTVAVREWIEDSQVWHTLVWRAGCRTQHHAHHLIAVLLSRRALAPCDLVGALASLGALLPSRVPSASRLAMQAALLSALPAVGLEVVLDLFGELSSALCFEHLSEEGIDLLVRLTERALALGYDATGGGEQSVGLARSLAVSQLLRYLQWGYRQLDPPEELLEAARRALLHSLAPHPALAPLLPAVAAEALALAALPAQGSGPRGVARCAHALGALAVDAAAAAAAAAAVSSEGPRVCTSAVACLCGALPPVGVEAPFSPADAQVWVAALVDALACFLRIPAAQIAAPQVGTLWSRLIVRPVFGLSVSAAAMQYFKLAHLAQPAAASKLVAPLLAAPNPPPEVRLAHASIFSPASFEDDPPPLPAAFFFPMAQPAGHGQVGLTTPGAPLPGQAEHGSFFGDSPQRFPQPLRRCLDSTNLSELEVLSDVGFSDEGALAAAAAASGLTLPECSAAAPRLRLDRVQAVLREPNASLLGELTAYDAIERRLWDDFDERGTVEDAEALRDRDASAIRCLAALDREINAAGAAGRDLPAPLTEARAKFSRLCELIVSGSAAQAARRIRACEEACAQREEELIEAKAAQERQAAQSRRTGETAPPGSASSVAVARSALARANVLLVAELRHMATRAALGLVEVIGTEGLARALRVAGRAHGDPLLDRLQRHRRWASSQAEREAASPPPAPTPAPPAPAAGTPPPPPPVETAAASEAARLAAIAAREDEAIKAELERPEGLSGYTEVRELVAGRVYAARRRGAPVALKRHAQSTSPECRRELLALRKLRGRGEEEEGVARLLGAFEDGGALYLELAWTAGGTLEAWCERHPGLVDGRDAEAVMRCLAILRQLWAALARLHQVQVVHGDVSLANVLLTADHRPVLADFERSILPGGGGGAPAQDWRDASRPTEDYAAPELEAEGCAPSPPADVYAGGVLMAKAFLGLHLAVAACPYDAARKQRRLPDDELDVDVADLLQLLLAQDPAARLTAHAAASHRAFEPFNYLRRRGLLGASANAGRSGAAAAEAMLTAAEQLRDEFRDRRVDDRLMFSREAVFKHITNLKVGEWPQDNLLGEWRVMLDEENGVDGGGLRREVVSLFFEQLSESNLVIREGSPPTLFIADRVQAGESPVHWRQIWSAVGAMILRAVVQLGNAPIAFSSAIFDCALKRIGRLPPDMGDDSLDGGVAQLAELRSTRGDEWARGELLDLLRRVRHAEPQKEASYRWMLAQRTATASSGSRGGASSSSYSIPADTLETFAAMLEKPAYQFLLRGGSLGSGGAVVHTGAVLDWALLWDIYLKYLGGGDRWLAYEALEEGLTAKGRRLDLWAPLTGEQIVAVFEGASLAPDVVLENLEFKPSYGYDRQINNFRRVIESFSSEELARFLRFATGIGRLPVTRRFPAGQKLTIRFMPDDLEKLPSAHTCFWVVDLPPYEAEAELAQKLRQAIAAPQPFALS